MLFTPFPALSDPVDRLASYGRKAGDDHVGIKREPVGFFTVSELEEYLSRCPGRSSSIR